MSAQPAIPEGAPAPASVPAIVAPQPLASAERVHFDTVLRWGRTMAASGFFKDAREAAQAMVKIQAGHELGVAPAAAMRGVFVFDGKISLSAALMTSKVNESLNYEYEVKHSDEKRCLIEWHGRSKRTREWRRLGESSFTIEEAQRAGLLGKDNWKHYPKAMLFARAMSAGCRTYCPELFNGAVYVPEEVSGTVTVDADGNVLSYEAPPTAKAEPTNVTPITKAPSANSRDELLAAARAANGIDGKSMTGEQMKSLLAAISSTLGKAFATLRDVSDDDLRAYLGAPADDELPPLAPEDEVRYCPSCGAQVSPARDATPHEEGCELAGVPA